MVDAPFHARRLRIGHLEYVLLDGGADRLLVIRGAGFTRVQRMGLRYSSYRLRTGELGRYPTPPEAMRTLEGLAVRVAREGQFLAEVETAAQLACAYELEATAG